jgi:hypothetical protein
MQLYCPKPGSNKSIIDLLSSKKEIKFQDIRAYLDGKDIEISKQSRLEKLEHDLEKLNARRKQRVHWASLVQSGGAQLDANFRLVFNRGPDPLPDLQPDLPPLRDNVDQQNEEIALILNPVEENRRLTEIEERTAATTISQMVHKYRNDNVPEEAFFFIPIKQRRQLPQSMVFTFRKIFIAVISCLVASTCLLLQGFLLPTDIPYSTPYVDKILSELLHIRDFTFHLSNCRGRQRQANPIKQIIFRLLSIPDCSYGVLLIPSLQDLRSNHQPFHVDEGHIHHHFQNNSKGINISWSLNCENLLTEEKHQRKCFRGVHDGWVTDTDLEEAIRFGATLITDHESDHFEIHQDVSLLKSQLPHLITRVRSLMETIYLDIDTQIEPVAFRFHAALPMSEFGIVPQGVSSELLPELLNEENYYNWLDFNTDHNQAISNSMFPSRPLRETCNLMADLEANSTFAIHTSIFLSNGAGGDFKGGHALFVDNYRNQDPRKRINRGVVIDGSIGRIIVSSGGPENLRCRLPTRSGIRAVLQIWWNIRDVPKYC